MQSFWDLSYAEGDHVHHWEDPDPEGVVERLAGAGWLGDGERAVDLGCGGGLEALSLAAHGFTVLGLDTSAGALAVAAARAAERPEVEDRVTWCRASALAIPVAAESIDLVHDRGCLHCFDEPATRRRYAAEIERVLGAAGRLIVTGARIDDDERGLTAVDRDTLAELFPASRWRVEAIETTDLDAPAGALPGLRAVLVRA